jgi:hypothetical protein
MAKKTTAKRIKMGWGAKFLNPNYKTPTPDERKVIREHGEPWDNRKWITTGVHHSAEEGRRYVAKHYPYIKRENVRTYGVRVAARYFSVEDEARLAKLSSKAFGGKDV